MSSLIQPLPNGPIDIVGDVHGEIDALQTLLGHLGYDAEGRHPSDRRLVFVGDLVNRGPDSPAVVQWVQQLVQSGAQCILGNHELNILIGNRRANSNWFYGETQLDDKGQIIPQRPADESMRQAMRDWFRRLPLALVREDLRVVHACWDAEMIELAREQSDVLDFYEHYKSVIQTELTPDDDDIQRRLEHQNRNPVVKLTSGPHEPSAKTTQRVAWWSQYEGSAFCVFGHYSHLRGEFVGSRSSLCIDFGIGKRWTERRRGVVDSFVWKLGALRFPELELVFDDGSPPPDEIVSSSSRETIRTSIKRLGASGSTLTHSPPTPLDLVTLIDELCCVLQRLPHPIHVVLPSVEAVFVVVLDSVLSVPSVVMLRR